MWSNRQDTEDLVIFTEKIFNGKLHFFCSGWTKIIEIICERFRKSPLFIEMFPIINFCRKYAPTQLIGPFLLLNTKENSG